MELPGTTYGTGMGIKTDQYVPRTNKKLTCLSNRHIFLENRYPIGLTRSESPTFRSSRRSRNVKLESFKFREFRVPKFRMWKLHKKISKKGCFVFFSPSSIFTTGIFSRWHFSQWHFYHLTFLLPAFLPLVFLPSDIFITGIFTVCIFTTGIFTFWHFHQWYFYLWQSYLWYFYQWHFTYIPPEHDHLDLKRLLYVFQYSRDRLNVKKWHKNIRT